MTLSPEFSFPLLIRRSRDSLKNDKRTDPTKSSWQYKVTRTFIVWLSLINWCSGVITHARHWIPTRNDMVHHVPSAPVFPIQTQSFTQNMRFHVTYDQSLRRLEPASRNLIVRKLIPEALDYFHKTFKVRRSKLPIKLQHMCREHSYFLKDSSGKHRGSLLFCKKECVKTYCGPVVIPHKHLDECRVCNENGSRCRTTVPNNEEKQEIKDKDFVLYVSSLETLHCVETKAVAYASYCQQEHSLDRPIAGFANICPNGLMSDSGHYPSLLATIKHEIFHALGFTAGLYAFYRDRLGRPLTIRDNFGLPRYNNVTNLYQWSDKVARKILREDWETMYGLMKHEAHVIVTPRVVQQVRRHFQCPTLEGAEIENQGPAGTRWTHWEKRLFENEAMTGTYTQNPVFSTVTLALMEDTGWYKANYRMSENLDWGKRLGCTFAKRSCRSWMKSRVNRNELPSPFCFQTKQTPLHTRCTHSKNAIALCNLQKYSKPLPKEYQYFSHLTVNESPQTVVIIKDTRAFGGSVSLADYCPFYQKFTLKNSAGKTRETSCLGAENRPSSEDNYALESYGEGSKCVEQPNQWTAQKGLLTRTMLDWGSGCYKYVCTKNKLQIIVGRRKYTCQKRDDIIHINGTLDQWAVSGTLRCPSCQEFCPAERCSEEWSLKGNTLNLEESLDHTTGATSIILNRSVKSATGTEYLIVVWTAVFMFH